MIQAVDHGELQCLEQIRKRTRTPGMGANGHHIDEVADRGVERLLRAPDGRHADHHLVLAGIAMQQGGEDTEKNDRKAHASGFGK